MDIRYIDGRILYKLLKRRNALYKYVHNACIEEDYAPEEIMKNKESLLNFLDLYGIGTAFTWDDTPEGANYWSRMEAEYYRALDAAGYSRT
jgi:hypothetical protein